MGTDMCEKRLNLRLMVHCWAGLLAIGIVGLGEPAWAKTAPEAAQKHYRAAVTHVERGDLRAAVVELKNALQGNPDNAEARLLLANVYLQLGDGGGAEKELKAARRLGHDDDQIQVPLGRALLLQGHFERVLAELSAEDAETGLEVLLLRGDAYAGLGEADDARALYNQVTESDPAEPRAYVGRARVALAEGKLVEAEAEAERALTRAPGLAEGLLVQAEARRLDGRPAAALAPFRQILDLPALAQATEVRARLGLTAALIALGRDAEAEKEVIAARTMAPGVPLAAYLDALIQLRQQDFAAARELLEADVPALQGFVPAQFLLGIVYYEAGELERARSRLLRYLSAHPNDLQARKLLAGTLLRLNEVEEAVASLENARAQAPEDPQVLLLLGTALLRRGQAADAAVLLERAAALAPDDPRVLSQLAVSQMATGQRDEALAALRATLDLGVDASIIGYAMAFTNLRAGAFGDALEVARDLRRRFPESALAANLEGAAYAGLGHFDRARTSFEAVLAIDPAFHGARANLAALKARTADFAGAEAEYREILRMAPSDVTALMGMAALAERRGERAETRRWLGKAVEVAPDAVEPSLALAEQHALAGEAAAAVTVLESLASRQPRSPQVLLALGNSQREAGQLDSSVRTYEQLVEVTGGSIAARRLLAEAQLSAGYLDPAKRSYEQLSTDARDDPVVWNNLAWLYHQAGDPRAASLGERALELAPSEPAVMDTLGWILLDHEDQLGRAAHLLGQAHRQAPDNSDIAYHYAVALHRTGDSDAAQDLVRRVLEQDEFFATRPEAEALSSMLAQ